MTLGKNDEPTESASARRNGAKLLLFGRVSPRACQAEHRPSSAHLLPNRAPGCNPPPRYRTPGMRLLLQIKVWMREGNQRRATAHASLASLAMLFAVDLSFVIRWKHLKPSAGPSLRTHT